MVGWSLTNIYWRPKQCWRLDRSQVQSLHSSSWTFSRHSINMYGQQPTFSTDITSSLKHCKLEIHFHRVITKVLNSTSFGLIRGSIILRSINWKYNIDCKISHLAFWWFQSITFNFCILTSLEYFHSIFFNEVKLINQLNQILHFLSLYHPLFPHPRFQYMLTNNQIICANRCWRQFSNKISNKSLILGYNLAM